MKRFIVVLFVISILCLVACNKKENVENTNIVENTENQQQNEVVDNIDKIEDTVDFANRIATAREKIENITQNSEEDYGIMYTSIKQNGEKYLLKIAFSKYIDSSDPDYPVLDGNDIKIIEIELNAEDKIVVTQPWILLDGSNQEMQAGQITAAELCDFGYFSYDTRNGLYFDRIDENNIYISINMAGLT